MLEIILNTIGAIAAVYLIGHTVFLYYKQRKYPWNVKSSKRAWWLGAFFGTGLALFLITAYIQFHMGYTVWPFMLFGLLYMQTSLYSSVQSD